MSENINKSDLLTIEDFFEGISKPVNKKLLKIFNDLEYTDQTGHGIPLIVEKYGKEAFYISEHTIIVKIPIDKTLLEEIQSNNEDLNEIEEKILLYLKSNPKYTICDLADLSKFSKSYINKVIKSLKNKKYIERVGADKNGYWKILK